MTTNITKSRRVDQPAKSDWLASLSYAQQQRLRFFEARLLWEGQVNRQDVCAQFRVTPNHFTREVRGYQHYFPDNIWYDISRRTYRPRKKFQARFSTGRPEEYLALLKLYTHNPSPTIMTEMGSPVACEVLGEPQGQVGREVLQEILAAIHGQCGCQIKYQSFSAPSVTTRTVWPHALAWAGYRWHVRAYDAKRKAYVDLVLVRISSASSGDIPLPGDAGEDADWLETEMIEIVPNPDFSISQQGVIAKEYGMEKRPNGYVWPVTLRRCLIPYFLYRYRLDEDRRGQTTRRAFSTQRIVVRDQSIIAKYIFPAD